MDLLHVLFGISALLVNYDVSGLASGNAGNNRNMYTGYRAKKYGRYYKNVNSAYSGGIGYARYSRVYAGKTGYYTKYYNYMLSWLGSEEFKVYKNTPSGSISVCRNYEANKNGSYLGVFTCPLPFVPPTQTYCCGLTNAEYCCTFWDVPLNVVAAVIIVLMLVSVCGTIVYISMVLGYSAWQRYTVRKELRKSFRLLKRLHNVIRWQEKVRLLKARRGDVKEPIQGHRRTSTWYLQPKVSFQRT